MRSRKFRSFTLVELMVVISVILVLTTFVSLSLVNSKKKARDEKRVVDTNNIGIALDQFALDNLRKFPLPTSCTASDSGESVDYCFSSIDDVKSKLGNYLSPFPKDPLGGDGYGYDYIVTNNGQRAAIIVKKIEAEKSLCNVNLSTSDLPEVMKKYVNKYPITRPEECYYYVAR